MPPNGFLSYCCQQRINHISQGAANGSLTPVLSWSEGMQCVIFHERFLSFSKTISVVFPVWLSCYNLVDTVLQTVVQASTLKKHQFFHCSWMVCFFVCGVFLAIDQQPYSTVILAMTWRLHIYMVLKLNMEQVACVACLDNYLDCWMKLGHV